MSKRRKHRSKTKPSTQKMVRSKRNHKDLVFRMYFNDSQRLLQLYNALNESEHTDIANFTFTTLENAVYLNYKNDLSFIFDSRLNLYEHQSTENPNIPLRMLFYVSSILQVVIENEDLFLRRMVKIPAPRFVVFYNGEEPAPARWSYRLSDLYECEEESIQLELIVDVININADVNAEILEKCRPLWEYAQLVKRIRDNRKAGEVLDDAVRNAVDSCIQDGIMSDFLRKNKAEVIAMGVFEYDEEMHLKNVREEGREAGIIFEKLRILQNMISVGGLSPEAAMDLAGIAEGDRKELLQALGI